MSVINMQLRPGRGEGVVSGGRVGRRAWCLEGESGVRTGREPVIAGRTRGGGRCQEITPPLLQVWADL